MTRWWSRLRPDNHLALLCTVGLASLLPMKGAAAIVLDDVTTVAIAALFFLHGARCHVSRSLAACCTGGCT